MKVARNIAIIGLIALAIAVLPGGGPTLNVGLALLGIAFFGAIGFFGLRLYREHRFTLDSLSDFQRIVLYCSIGLAFLAWVASPRLFNDGGVGVLVFIAMLALASYGAFWVWIQSQRYS
jgi:drug/metabolite transporter (DMT)-like permease